MKTYVCQSCGMDWYSSAEIRNMVKPYCEKCGGEIKEEAAPVAPETASRKIKLFTLYERREGKSSDRL
jgi:predicted amidophosphoribosyltransferase